MFNVLLLLAFFHGLAHAKDASHPCADSLYIHLDTNQPFTPLGYLEHEMEKREAATLLLRFTPNGTRMTLNEMKTLGLPAEGGVRLMHDFSVMDHGEAYYVITGSRADLISAQDDLQKRLAKGAFAFQILGSEVATTEFQMSHPRETIELHADAKAFAEFDRQLADNAKARYGIYLENAPQLAFVIPANELRGITDVLFKKMGITRVDIPEGTLAGEWLSINGARMGERLLIEHGQHVLLSQPALYALKQLAGEPIPAVAQANVIVNEILAREIRKCTELVCVVPTPAPLLALEPAATPPVKATPTKQPFLDSAGIGPLLSFVAREGNAILGRKGELTEQFVAIYQKIAPDRVEDFRADLKFKPTDRSNAYSTWPAQDRLLSAFRWIADVVNEGGAPAIFTGANIQETVANYVARVGVTAPAKSESNAVSAAEPATTRRTRALVEDPDAEYPIIEQPGLSLEDLDALMNFVRKYAPGVSPSIPGQLGPAFIAVLDRFSPTANLRHAQLIADLKIGQSDFSNGRSYGAAQRRTLTAFRIVADVVLGTYQPRRVVDRALIDEVAAKYAAAVMPPPAARPPEPEPAAASTPVAPVAAPAAPAPAAAPAAAPAPSAPVRLDFKPMELATTEWTLKRKADFLFAPERQGIWSRRPLAMINNYGGPYFLLMHTYYTQSVSPAEAIAKLEAETRVDLSPAMRAWIERTVTHPEVAQTVEVHTTTGAAGSQQLQELNKANRPFYLVASWELEKPVENQHRVLAIPMYFETPKAQPNADPRTLRRDALPVPPPMPPPLATSAAAAPVSGYGTMDAYLKRNLEYALEDGPERRKLVIDDKGRAKVISFLVKNGEIADKRISFIDQDGEKRFWEQVGREQGFESIKHDLTPSLQATDGRHFTSLYLTSGTVARLSVKNEFDDVKMQEFLGGIHLVDVNPDGNMTAEVRVGSEDYTVKAVAQDKRLTILDAKLNIPGSGYTR